MKEIGVEQPNPGGLDKMENSHEKLAEEVKGLRDILEVAKNVVSSLDLDAVLQNILDNALDIAQMPAGSIALYQEENKELTIHAHKGLSESFISRRTWRVVPGGLAEQILANQDFFIIEDTAQAEFFKNPLALQEKIRAVIAMPLRVQEKIVGILYLDDFRPRRISESRLKKLSILTSFAAMSIDNARLHSRMRELACTDGLTNLYNHRQFKKVFREELSRSLRYHKNLSLVFLDVDDFKAFNDRFGHPCGDRALMLVADILRTCFREVDTLCRYGGEEFVAVLPEACLDEALVAAERARSEVAAGTVEKLGGENLTGLTVSVGVATFPRDGQSASDLLQVVDALMYRAKKEGKNRLYYQESEPTPES